MSTGESLSISPVPLHPNVESSFLQHRRRAHVLVDPEYRIWDRTVIKWIDGRYHAYYSRWLGKFRHWLTDSEVCHAVADQPEGPFTDTGVVLKNRNANGWDIVDAHSQYACVDDDQILLYYQSNDLRGTFELQQGSPLPTREWLDDERNWNTIRNSQRIGLAVSKSPTGPFERVKRPVATPDDCQRIKNLTTNPAVIKSNGRYLMVLKSDDAQRTAKYRIQVVGHSANPEGPFHIQNEPVYSEKQTEDATVWYDKLNGHFYMVCHVMGESSLAMFTSLDGFNWQHASQPVLMKKEFLFSNGKIWKPERVEQPRILTDDNGKPVMIFVAVFDKGINGNIAVPLKSSG